MKPLQLNKDHQKKLLEMSKKLFPEYKHFGFENDLAKDGIMEYHNNDWNKMKLIHWFEFCVFHLQKKLLEESIKNNISDITYHINHSNWLEDCLHKTWKIRTLFKDLKEEHPIDCLYNLFQKLKL